MLLVPPGVLLAMFLGWSLYQYTAREEAVVEEAPGGPPAGVVFAFAGSSGSVPEGWLLCDGRAVSRSDNAALYVAIGAAHGAGDGSSTFHLPDYRGRFLRGVDLGAGRDPDATAREAAVEGGQGGDLVGSVQEDGLAAHSHDYSSFRLRDVDWMRGVKHPSNGTGDLKRSGTTGESGGSETRPENAAVNWIIHSP